MILPFFSEKMIHLIKDGKMNAHLLKDENCKWKIGSVANFWRGIPCKDGSIEFAKGKIIDIKDAIWYPDKETVVIIDKEGKWEHLKSEKLESFVKSVGYSSIEKFKELKSEYFESRVLYWNKSQLEIKR